MTATVTVSEILEIQGLGIDAVSGATLTYNAVMDCVIDCLMQAGLTEAQIAELQEVRKEVVKEDDLELTADVVIIGAGGAGGAGMAVAVTANQEGKSVIVLEKTDQMGGNALTDTIVFGRIAGSNATNFER